MVVCLQQSILRIWVLKWKFTKAKVLQAANHGQDWDNLIKQLRFNVIRKLEKILHPRKIELSTGSFKGSIYGISSNSKFAAFIRQSAKSKTYSNLYFCGGSAHPGGGIPLVLISGKLAIEAILKHENKFADKNN